MDNTSPDMTGFSAFVDHIEDLTRANHGLNNNDWMSATDSGLNGAAAATLQRVVASENLRNWGAYFTPPALASLAAVSACENLSRDSIVLDPACGAGDLLIAVANNFPLQDTLGATVRAWGGRLYGYDLQPEFVRACKARLILLAMRRLGLDPAMVHRIGNNPFPNIRVGDALSECKGYLKADCVLMNPPFGLVKAPTDCGWSEGLVNSAGLFVTKVLSACRKDTRLVAILPDVLRSGRRYAKWREQVTNKGVVEETTLFGNFGRSADVDVFLLSIQLGKNALAPGEHVWNYPPKHKGKVIGDYFNVRVGPVVPYRDKEKGCEYRYIHAKSLPPWGVLKRVSEKRRYQGTLFKPPFVAVRRTSRPEDKKRAVATLVLGQKDVAVENHVLVLMPHDGSVESCNGLIARLRSELTDDWLNRRIRCKHLTVGVVAGIPWWPVS